MKNLLTNRALTWALLAAFLVAAILTAVLTFTAVRDFFAAWELTNLPGVPVSSGGETTPDPGGALVPGIIDDPTDPLQPVGGPTPEPWDGASRVTVLMLGLDYRDWESGAGAPRTDTMMLLSLDPLTRTAGMLSIPRDLWVNIPGGFEYGRINTAYSLGEQYDLPGGGPQLAKDTVEELLGVPVNYYALIDFSAFVQFIDEIGGVKVDVQETIEVDPLGDNNTKKLKPGRQTLPGDLALAYARARKHAGDDFGRAERQQQVILGIREQVLRFNMIPTLITKAPALYQDLSAGIHTDLSLEQVIQLAWLAQQIPDDQIKRGVIAPPEMVSLAKTDEGDEVLKPIFDKIRVLRDEIFATAPISPLAAGGQPVDLMKAEAARISILNGSSTAGLAARTTEYLQAQGANITNTGNADSLYPSTTIIDYTGKPYTLQYLVDLMGIQPNQIYSRYDPASPVDVAVLLGNDWAASDVLP
jgi:LCP family protein required for cell wall assembly